MIEKKRRGKRGPRVICSEWKDPTAGNPRGGLWVVVVVGGLIRAALREGTPRHAKAGHTRRGEARWRGDTKGEGDEATA